MQLSQRSSGLFGDSGMMWYLKTVLKMLNQFVSRFFYAPTFGYLIDVVIVLLVGVDWRFDPHCINIHNPPVT